MLPATLQRPAALREARSRSVSRSIPLGRDGLHQVWVDDADYEWLSEYNWCLTYGYARHTSNRSLFPSYRMHRIIMGVVDPSQPIDHVDGDRLNNTRSNLRLVTHAQNALNRRANKQNKYSKYKGVTRLKHEPVWVAQIGLEGEHYNLGYFLTQEEAACAYDRAARNLFGEYAWLNFPEFKNHPRPTAIARGASGFKGVSWAKYPSRWMAEITHEGKIMRLGTFKDVEQAARAYDHAVRLYKEPYAPVNFPLEECW